MGYVIQKFFSHLVDLDLILNVPLELIICRFQLTDGCFQAVTDIRLKLSPRTIDLIAYFALHILPQNQDLTFFLKDLSVR